MYVKQKWIKKEEKSSIWFMAVKYIDCHHKGSFYLSFFFLNMHVFTTAELPTFFK